VDGTSDISGNSADWGALVDAAPDLFCVASADGHFVRANRAWTTSLGWPHADLMKLGLLELVHADDRAITSTAVDQWCQQGETLGFINRVRAYDGTYRVLEWRASALDTGHFVGTARDVSERAAVEDATRASADRFRRIFELVPTPLVLTQADGAVLLGNRAFLEASGYQMDELLARRVSDQDLWPRPEQRRALADGLRRSDQVIGLEAELQRQDGKRRMVQLTALNLQIGSQQAVLIAIRDVTDQQALERRMLQSQKLESLGVLAGGIAHDFNNLLTGILGNADLARAELSPLSPACASLEGIEGAARRAAELCRQLLAYSGKGRFLIEPVDLVELVEEMGHLLAVSITKKVVLKYHFGKGVPPVEADATQLRQVLMNLIVNASEAIGERSGVISVTTGLANCDAEYLRGCFSADGTQPGDFAYVEVADTGQGMDKATLDRIFDPFFTTKFTGRGLGLAAVLGIVRGHRGAIKVYSEPGRGTTFKLLFPIAEQFPAKAHAPQESNDLTTRGPILLADDEETVRNLGRRMLEKAGFTVLVASDGREALEAFRLDKDNIALVILDLTMPHLDGDACYRELRQVRSDVRVLLSSGYNEQDVVTRFAGKGLAGFIQKPYTTQELLAKVKQALG
jgi:PAS domain S-box-containing protein